MDWMADQLESAKETLIPLVAERGAVFLLNVVLALLILLFGRWVARVLTRLARRVLGRANVDETLARFLGNVVYALLLTMVVVFALDRLGVNTTSVVAILGAAGLAVGLALQDSLGNFAAGVMIVLFKPFKLGDFVEVAGTKGTVEEIHIFNTRLRTPDNVVITVPNGQITDDAITNFSAKDTRRIDMVVGCGYDDDLRAVRSFLEELLTSDSRILEDPAPLVAVDELGDSSINFVVRPWVLRVDYAAVKWDLNEKIKIGFDERGFQFPYPSRDVYIHAATEG